MQSGSLGGNKQDPVEELSAAQVRLSLSLVRPHLGLCFRLKVRRTLGVRATRRVMTFSIYREIAIFDTDDSLVQTFTNSVFLYPCAVEFQADTREAYVLGKY